MDNLATTYQHIADILSFETPNSQLEKTISEATFNWENIVKHSSRHLIIPTIYCRLKSKQLLSKLPEDLINYLEYITSENRKRNAVILLQINDISILLNSNNIDHVFLKGSALLALGCFNDISERMLGDIDLLVKPNQIDKAYQLLINEGYTPLDPTLGNDFFEHKHLPRLETALTKRRIAAVEVHRKLFNSYNYKEPSPVSVFKEIKQQNGVFIPSIKHLLMHNILNYQISDHGTIYNTVNFKSAYDTIILLHGYTDTKNWFKIKVFKKYFKYTSLFFKEIKNETNSKTDISTNFYMFKLKHIKFYKFWNSLTRLMHVIPILSNRLQLFISNKTYRKSVIKDKNRIITQLKSDFNKF